MLINCREEQLAIHLNNMYMINTQICGPKLLQLHIILSLGKPCVLNKNLISLSPVKKNN